MTDTNQESCEGIRLAAFRAVKESVDRWHEMLDPGDSFERSMLVSHNKKPSYWYLMGWHELGGRLAELSYTADEIAFIFTMFGSGFPGYWPNAGTSRVETLSEYFAAVSTMRRSTVEKGDGATWDQRVGVSQALRVALLSIVRTGTQIRWLTSEARTKGGGALVSLVEIDKSALEFGGLGELLRHAEMRGDWEYLRKLGEALGRDATQDDLFDCKWVGLVAFFWEEWLSEMRYSDLLSFLVEEGLVPRVMKEDTLKKTLGRAKLHKNKN